MQYPGTAPVPCILVLEDNPSDLALITLALRRGGLAAEVRSASTRAEFTERLTPDVDLVLSDHALPDVDAVEALRLVKETRLDVPLIIVSGTITEELAVTALRAGAVDYVVKDRLGRLAPAVERALEHRQVRREKAALSKSLEAERALLRYAFEHAPAFIARVKGPSHVFEMANPAYHRLVGHRDLIGKSVSEALPEVVEQGFIALLDGVLATGEPFFATEMPVLLQRRPDAEPEQRCVNFVYLPVYDGHGVASGIFCHGVDVTEQVRARREAERVSRDNQVMMDRSLDVICTIDRDGRFVRVSAAAEALWGYTPEELVGRTYLDLVVEEDREKTAASVARVMGGEPVTDFENRYLRRDGRVVTQLWSARWLEEDGLMFCVARDVTELLRQRAELLRSEQRFRALVESSAQVIWIADEYGFVTERGDAWERFTGQTKQESCGWRWTEAIHPEDLARITPIWQEALASKQVYAFKYRVRRADGRYHWFSVRGVPLFDAEGRFVEWIGTCTDIQEKKQAEEALQESEARYRLLFDNSLDGVLLTAPDGRILKANPAMCQMVGYTEEEICALGRTGLVDRTDPRLPAAIAERERTGYFRGELTFIRKDGSKIPVEVSSAVYRDPSGEVRTSMFVRDVTELRANMKELVEAKEKAEEMSRLKDAFLANMSHEIRTPLTSIIGFSEILREVVTGDGLQFAEAIEASGQRLLRTLESVLDLAQIESGTLRLQESRFDLVHEVQEVVSLLHRAAEKKGLVLSASAAASPLPVVLDRGVVSRILMNLVSNAVKFTRQGSVTVKVREEGSEAVIDVTDTGIGISAAFLPHIFDEFRQESTGQSRSHEGNGLGLTITKRLVDLVGGAIRAESEPGRGTTMTVRFPNGRNGSRSDEAPLVQGCEESAEKGRENAHTTNGVDGRPRVLLVDDVEHTRALAGHYLKDTCTQGTKK